jgi:rod shape determining protein RodA
MYGNQQAKIAKGVDPLLIWLYYILVSIGILAIFMVEYKEGSSVVSSFLAFKTNYSKQFIFLLICSIVGIVILLTDSKFFTATANLQYAFGILLMLLVFVIGKNVGGSKSWIAMPAGFNLQPADMCKIFVALALAKFLSQIDMDFTDRKSQLIAFGITLAPAALSIAQNETGLSLVYFSFFMVMYREGLSPAILIVGALGAALLVASLLIDNKIHLSIGLSVVALLVYWFYKRASPRESRKAIPLILLSLALSIGFCWTIPYVIKNFLPPHQAERIMNLVGKEYVRKDKDGNPIPTKVNEKGKKQESASQYNVRQSKIAIGSGGFFGKGFMKGTQTRGDFVPAQHTDFIFTSIGEAFGFGGSFLFICFYSLLLFRIVYIAERQRSAFSRIYGYSVASILFFHICVNICMTIGLAPVIGITLPFISYGGSSLMTFTILLFILIKLDADRQMILR